MRRYNPGNTATTSAPWPGHRTAPCSPVAGTKNILYIYQPGEDEPMEPLFREHTDWIRGISWSSDGDLVAAASDDNTSTVWSVSAGALIRKHSDHTDYCRDVVFSPDGNSLLTVSDDYYGYIYDPADAELADRSIEGHEGWIFTADWSPNGRMIVTGDNNAQLIVHHLRGNKGQDYYNDPDEETDWLDVDWAPNSQSFAATSAYQIIILEPGADSPSLVLNAEGGNEVSANALDEIPVAGAAGCPADLPFAGWIQARPHRQRL